MSKTTEFENYGHRARTALLAHSSNEGKVLDRKFFATEEAMRYWARAFYSWRKKTREKSGGYRGEPAEYLTLSLKPGLRSEITITIKDPFHHEKMNQMLKQAIGD